ncbi:non-hydrolyzing UDP-N-acetylglucosamine 2-epimerase [Desulfobacter curvatus]|uniref:non-hydrolyzing UDP-N-acetylglucosamine 2-epimerase n=1 Tax=Desulfobacter curvatus TaxID=2290 RepID=UPI0003617D06|nr:UDP-N-acetylglucosamine 2-epimerase (non-hydrolyzing) [Desulfobacter curvatus]
MKNKKKIFCIFGTRPEAIKMVALIKKITTVSSMFQPVVCVTAQHREMLDQVLFRFNIVPEYDLNVMKKGQDIFELTSSILTRLKPILKKEKPDLILVQGDTTTAFVGSLAAYYMRIPVGHIEAGLRTYQKYSPFPEEVNRHLISVIADYHFAPTTMAKKNLIAEGINENSVWVTGNTVIDTLLMESRTGDNQYWKDYFNDNWKINLDNKDRKLVLVTGHRRESFGKGFENICQALKEIARRHSEIDLVYPVHLNPNVKKPAFEILGEHNNKNIFLLDPLDYSPFVYLMNHAYFILTDSGGIQEEAPSLGKPVLVMRETTERPEGIDAGTCKLVGSDTDQIVNEAEILIKNKDIFRSMAQKKNPYGDGHASEKIIGILSDIL